MNKNLTELNPKTIWANFQSLLDIPRPSKKEEKVIQFMVDFGKKLGLETIVDDVQNVIIKKPATLGMENRMVVVLQGHLDMVPQKNSDKVHDFEKDPIEAYIDGEWVTANGTTLGADNGMGVAAAMSVLQATDLVHGPIECLFTIDEETGMTGAFGLKKGLLKGDILMNLDSEDEGELYIGCAGGIDTSATFNYESEPVPAGSNAYKITITGLKGGHSGLDIILQRGNSNKMITRFMWNAFRKMDLRLASIEGGSLRNAIPREAFAVVTVPADKQEAFKKYAVDYYQTVKKELASTEPEFKFEVLQTEMPTSVIDKKTTDSFLSSVYGCPNGVIRMSDDMVGLTETSLNLAIIKSVNGKITINCLLRSSVDSAKEDLTAMVESVFVLAGAKVVHEGAYPGWKPNVNSPILKTMKEIYQNKFGKTPDVKAIHAGLECGLLGEVYPNMDMISFGPTIRFPHSPDEKVNIASVQKFWDYLVETLKNVPVK